MIYVLALSIILTIIFIIRNKRKNSSIFLLIMLLSLIVVSICFTLFMAKDNSYYYLIHNYFNISTKAWTALMFLPIEKDTIIRLLNISSLLFIYSSLCFPLAFTSMFNDEQKKRLTFILAVFPALQIILFDPEIYASVYLYMYPDFLTTETFKVIQNGIYIFTKIFNQFYLIGGITILVFTFIKSSHIRFIKNYTLLILVSHFFLVIYYNVVLWWAPTFLVKVSKVASYKAYSSLPLGKTAALYQLFPFLVLFTFGLISFLMYKYSFFQKQMQSTKLEISKNIDAANITSSVFCHYMKNELLAMMAEIELMKSEPKDIDLVRTVHTIEERCTNIYERLDTIHRSTRLAKLNLKPVAVSESIKNVINNTEKNSLELNIEYNVSKINPYALIDEEYFSVVIENLLKNAIDATGKDITTHIKVLLEIHNPWIIIYVRDNGVGIPKDKIDKIFNPFFSSKPTSTNWGVGLSMCHKIITAHDGKIDVESEEGAGTTIKILLPLLFTTK